MTENKAPEQEQLPPPKRQVARSNRAGSTILDPKRTAGDFYKWLTVNNLSEWSGQINGVCADLLQSFLSQYEPPPDPKTVDSAHIPPTDELTDERLAEIEAAKLGLAVDEDALRTIEELIAELRRLRAERWAAGPWVRTQDACRPRSRWQPIETAPRDGTPIDVWFGDDATDEEIDFYCDPDTRRSPGWAWKNGKFRPCGGFQFAVFIQPQYWMPIPDGPEASE